MDKVRWETLVLAAAILLGALLISMAMRANRYAFMDATSIGDTQTGALYMHGTPDQVAQWANTSAAEKGAWIKVGEPLK
jgi:hypothetical protein